MGGLGRVRTYLCIDLKSFYASVECVDRGLDPLSTDLVVADPDRGRSTICLAITPRMKERGVKNRCRLFEIPDGIDYLVATPRMRRYMEVSSLIYRTYLRYVSPNDLYAYSIDECFIDATPYLALYRTDARSFARMLMDAVLAKTGVYATAGIGTNLFLAKVALDITAKREKDRIGYLDEPSFKASVWRHRPLTDIWNIGPGTAERLARHGVVDLEGVTRLDRSLLEREFGVNAQLLIDHAHGREDCTIDQIRSYRPRSTSISNGQVLMREYSFDEALVVLKEMVYESALELVERRMVAGHVSLMVGYAVPGRVYRTQRRRFTPETAASASRKLSRKTSSRRYLEQQIVALYEEKVDPARPVKRMSIALGRLEAESCETLDLFTDVRELERERALCCASIEVRNRYGKNSLIRGIDALECATARQRNVQIGGHRA